ncbi:hypothetical protein MTO96_039218, partial [Rhipicephalus appendiculatus]
KCEGEKQGGHQDYYFLHRSCQVTLLNQRRTYAPDPRAVNLFCTGTHVTTKNDDLAMCKLRIVDEIVKEVVPSPTSHPKMADNDDKDDDFCSASEQPPSMGEVMHALDI